MFCMYVKGTICQQKLYKRDTLSVKKWYVKGKGLDRGAELSRIINFVKCPVNPGMLYSVLKI